MLAVITHRHFHAAAYKRFRRDAGEFILRVVCVEACAIIEQVPARIISEIRVFIERVNGAERSVIATRIVTVRIGCGAVGVAIRICRSSKSQSAKPPDRKSSTQKQARLQLRAKLQN